VRSTLQCSGERIHWIDLIIYITHHDTI
jgi:hypothetical protein